MKTHLLIFRFIPFILISSVVLGIWLGGHWVWLGPLTIFGLHPLLDQLLGNSLKSDDGLGFENFHNFILKLYPFIQFALLIFATAICIQRFDHISPIELLGIIIAVGAITGGVGITVSHELIHRTQTSERFLGVFLLSMVNYAHFRIEHVYGHHRHVATPKDAAFVRVNQSLYSFLISSLIKSFLSAWKIEKKVAKRWYKNRMIHYLAISAIVSLFIFFTLPLIALLFWWGQSLIAIILVEAVNYIEHYGLVRKKINGRYEKVTEMHSWDSDFGLTNHSLFNLGKHAHHHAEASTHFYHLKNSTQASDLPVGYAGAIVLAFIPPIWKTMMREALKKRTEGTQVLES